MVRTSIDVGENHTGQHMNVQVDLNTAIDAYSHAMGNHMGRLKEYVVDVGSEADANSIACQISGIQGSLYQIVMDTANEIGFSPNELEKIVDSYAQAECNWLNDLGKQALLRWLVWMSWHEGYLVNRARDYIDSVVLTLTSGEVKQSGNPEVANALEWLMSTDPSSQAFVIVEARDGGPFVQFAGSSVGSLIMDVPLAPLDDRQRDTLVRFFRRGGLDIESGLPSFVVQVGLDIGLSAQLTDQILIGLFGLSTENISIVRADEDGLR